MIYTVQDEIGAGPYTSKVKWREFNEETQLKMEEVGVGPMKSHSTSVASFVFRFPNLFSICIHTFKYNQQIVCWEARAGRGVLCSTPL
jgi:hypothetical protein